MVRGVFDVSDQQMPALLIKISSDESVLTQGEMPSGEVTSNSTLLAPSIFEATMSAALRAMSATSGS